MNHTRRFSTVNEAFAAEKEAMRNLGNYDGLSIEWCKKCRKYHFVTVKPEKRYAAKG
jgi:hypothetical protein